MNDRKHFMRATRRASVALSLWSVLLLAAPAAAQTGISDDRVSLPEGPGSLEGIGDDVDVNANMGQMSYSASIILPDGYAGMTPSMGLSYSSGGDASVVGMGWDIPMMAIERLTLRRLPLYDLTDEFTASGDQLVYVEGSDPREHRSRFEGGFARYRWYGAGTGDQGYWTAEYPDGRVGYFGADAEGNLVDTARVGGEDGTFRYLLVDMTDVWGHHIEYSYGTYASTSLLEHIGYVFQDGDPVYEVELTYEAREDWINNATGGFEELNDQRLDSVDVIARGTTIRRYELSYEDYTESGGFTRLSGVSRTGVDGTPYPIQLSFAYSRSLGDVCEANDCERPFTVDMDSLESISLQTGDTQIVDINGDGLGDILDTSQSDQPHRFFINTLGADGSHGFSQPIDSTIGTQNNFDVSSSFVQLLDVNGDGFTDILNANSGQALLNLAGYDWDDAFAMPGLTMLNESDLQSARFMDYNGDHLIDMVRSENSGDANVTTIYENDGPTGFEADTIEPIGAGFDSDSIELNDMNGDGLMDAMQVVGSEVRYRLNLGWGRWTGCEDTERWTCSGDWRIVNINGGPDLNGGQRAAQAEFEDLNGDALADMVLVEGDDVFIWINRNGRQFESSQDLDDELLGVNIPTNDAMTTVLFADMNGNGSSDVVWVTNTGNVTYLELFPVRPNLLAHVENGIGLIIDVQYGTSVDHMARDAGTDNEWQYVLPFPNTVVNRIDETDLLTNVHRIRTFLYRDGYYDGIEKAFRGYAYVEEHLNGDDSQQGGAIIRTYDVGAVDTYRNGLTTSEEVRDEDGNSLLWGMGTYGDCDVDGIPEGADLRWDVRHVCQLEELTEQREGRPENEWVRLHSVYTFDGYGNQTLEANEGIVSIGGGGCGPCTHAADEWGQACGSECLGDESYTETDYIVPGADTQGKWILNNAWRERQYADPDSERYSESLIYYDGEFFVGLEQGTLEFGSAARVVSRVDASGATITTTRSANDEHGNDAEEIDALGSVGGSTHRTLMTYDPTGLRITSIEFLLEDDDGPFSLRRDYRYETVFDQLASATAFYMVRNGDAVTPENVSSFLWDTHGRLDAIVEPGDNTAAPTITYEYDFSADHARNIARTRLSDTEFLESITCLDGRARDYQKRTAIGDGRYRVLETSVFGVQGEDRALYQPWVSSSDACESVAPEGVYSIEYTYDILRRPVSATFPDEAAGANTRYEYRPLEVWIYDENDTDSSSDHFDTPNIEVRDGQDRLVSMGRTPSAGAEPEWFTFEYTEMGDVARVLDPAGNERVQSFDLLGRAIEIDDPDRGVTTYTYDDVGNLVREENANGEVILREYDGASRLVSEWVEGAESDTRLDYTYDLLEGCPNGCTNAANQLVSMTFPVFGELVTDYFAYDARLFTTSVIRDFGTFQLEMGIELDNANRVIGVDVPGDHDVAYELDGEGNLVSIEGYLDDLEYGERADLINVSFANGVSSMRGFDARRRYASVDVVDAGGDMIVSYDWARDAQGLVVGMTDNAPFAGGPIGTSEFTYDAFSRLVSADLSVGDSEWGETVDYVYDEADNLLSRTSSLGEASPVHDGQRTYDTTHPHAVITAGDLTMAYDASGRMTQRGELTLAWDGFGRLASAENLDSEGSEYGYANNRERVATRGDVERIYHFGEDFLIEDGIASLYITIDGTSYARHEFNDLATAVLTDIAPASGADSGLIPEPDGMINAADAWLAYADSQGFLTVSGGQAPSDADDLLRSSARQNLNANRDRLTYFHRDHQDSLLAVTDADGAVVERVLNFPFGYQRWSSATGSESRNVTDERSDTLTDLVHIAQRHYDPLLGRWATPDVAYMTIESDELDVPWEAMGAYVYGYNSPLNGQDENGALWDKGKEQRDLATFVQLVAGLAEGGVTMSTTNFDEGTQGAVQRIMGTFGDDGTLAYGRGALALQLIDFAREHKTEILARIDDGFSSRAARAKVGGETMDFFNDAISDSGYQRLSTQASEMTASDVSDWVSHQFGQTLGTQGRRQRIQVGPSRPDTVDGRGSWRHAVRRAQDAASSRAHESGGGGGTRPRRGPPPSAPPRRPKPPAPPR